MSNASDVKQNNTIAIMRLMQQEGAMTKNNIAAALNLSTATVHNIITELKAKGFCRECQTVVATGGRNAVMHEINKEGGYIIGQDLRRDRIVTRVFDYGLNILYKDEVTQVNLHNLSETIRLMIDRIKHCIEVEKDRKFVGVGISMMGRPDKKGRVINIPGYPEWQNVHLTDILSSEIDLPIFVENDNNAATLAWKWSAGTKECENVVLFHIRDGVGTGILIKGRLFFGSNNNGCELGHVSIMVDGGPKCDCGNSGCLEAFLKDSVILQDINSLPQYQNRPVQTMKEAIEECENCEAVRDIFVGKLRYVMIGIEHIIKLFDPELIVIRNDWIKKIPNMFTKLQDLIHEKFSITELCNLRIIMDNTKIGNAASACVFLERFYSGETKNMYI